MSSYPVTRVDHAGREYGKLNEERYLHQDSWDFCLKNVELGKVCYQSIHNEQTFYPLHIQSRGIPRDFAVGLRVEQVALARLAS